MIFDFTVNDDKITLSGNSGAVAGSVNFYSCRFSFSHNWNDLEKFAVFIQGDKTYTVLIVDNVCLIPQEVTEGSGSIAVGVYGSSFDSEDILRISTDFSHIVIKEGAYREGSAPEVPKPELWEQYLQLAAEKAAEGVIDKVGNIDAALDTILAIQEHLIGGDGA